MATIILPAQMRNFAWIFDTMENEQLSVIGNIYGWQSPQFSAAGTGLINATWRVTIADGGTYVLQRVNTHVFRHPEDIDHNINLLADHLSRTAPGFLFTGLIPSADGDTLINYDGDVYRAFPWIDNSHTIDVVGKPALAGEAAHAFGQFTYLLSGLDIHALRITLPHFHDLGFRYRQFEQATRKGNQQRIDECAALIQFLLSRRDIVSRYDLFTHHPEAKQRVTHHDTKISNVLFDHHDKALCVIDLDTAMPGYFLSDVGDMFRTYTCPVSEEEADLDAIIVRKEYVKAIRDGYLSGMQDALSNLEKDSVYLGGEMLIYMQALRFLTDYFENDTYYGSKYPQQNKVRAANQARLLEVFQEMLKEI